MNVVAHNLPAINTKRQFNITTKNKAKSTEKLSSGYRINRAADDAAGLSISEKMRRQVRGLSQGIRNTQDGVSLCQVADGALAEVSDMLHRITELSVQSANGTNSDEDRKAIQHEISQILQEIDRVGDTTEFNTLSLFKEKIDGTVINNGSDKWVIPNIIKEEPFEIRYTGSNGRNAIFDGKQYKQGDIIKGTWLTLGETGYVRNSSDKYNKYTFLSLNGSSFFLKTENMQNNPQNQSYFSRIIADKNNISSIKISDLKVDSNGMVYLDNYTGRGKVYAALSDDLYEDGIKGFVFQLSNNYPGAEYIYANKYNDNKLDLWIQSGSEAGQGMWLEIDPMNTNILGINDLDASTADGANHALDTVKKALEKVSSSRSKIGAQQNRLEHTIANEKNIVENTTAAESRIRDTDMAKEMVAFSKEMILEKAGQAMLSQAYKSNQDVLSLLS